MKKKEEEYLTVEYISGNIMIEPYKWNQQKHNMLMMA